MLGVGALGELALGEVPSSGKITTVSIGWYAPLVDPVKLRIDPKLAVALAASGQDQFCPLPLVSFSWFSGLSEPTRFMPRLPAGEQQVLALQPAPSPFVATGWYNWLSEPVRTNPALPTPQQSVLTLYPNPIVSFSWFAELSKPQRLDRPRLPEAEQQFTAFNPQPFVSFSWYGWLPEPVRVPARLPAGEQQFISWTFAPSQISISWFKGLEEPPRFPKRLAAPLNPFHEFSNFVPLAYTAMLNARETFDLFLGVVWEYGTPVSAIVEVNEIVKVTSPVGLIENNHVSANVTLYEPVATPSSGTPILGVARANVAIREV